mmetsp:Transcript_19781/g.44005  ORF Transcript_19781/g.44005 Transcript_19781/m.44005 type:complete len:242 (+) Transcript_19781:555-1280(+)
MTSAVARRPWTARRGRSARPAAKSRSAASCATTTWETGARPCARIPCAPSSARSPRRAQTRTATWCARSRRSVTPGPTHWLPRRTGRPWLARARRNTVWPAGRTGTGARARPPAELAPRFATCTATPSTPRTARSRPSPKRRSLARAIQAASTPPARGAPAMPDAARAFRPDECPAPASSVTEMPQRLSRFASTMILSAVTAAPWCSVDRASMDGPSSFPRESTPWPTWRPRVPSAMTFPP